MAALAPHLRALVNTVRRAMFRVAADTDTVPINNETTTDIQRLATHFQPGAGSPTTVPFFKLFRLWLLTPPQIDTWTDASGFDAFGGHAQAAWTGSSGRRSSPPTNS